MIEVGEFSRAIVLLCLGIETGPKLLPVVVSIYKGWYKSEFDSMFAIKDGRLIQGFYFSQVGLVSWVDEVGSKRLRMPDHCYIYATRVFFRSERYLPE